MKEKIESNSEKLADITPQIHSLREEIQNIETQILETGGASYKKEKA